MIAALALVLCSEPVFAQAQSNVQNRPPAPMTYSVGDELKLSFYEPLKMPDRTDWASIGKPQLPGPSYYLHPELSGDYSIQSDWTISIPTIGTIVVAQRNAKEVETDLTNAFEKIIGHRGYVSISLVKREPLYIVGPVKQQGSYKFQPGLTPLSLVALAGGVLRDQDDDSAVVEAVREAGKQAADTDRLSSLLAQNAVLQSELQGKPVELPPQLVRLDGIKRAELLVNAEQAKRALVVQANSERRKELEVASVAAQNRLNVDQSRLPTTAASVEEFKNRMTSIDTLHSHGTVDKVVLEQARGELLGAEDRHDAVLISIGDDLRDLAQAKIGAAKFEADTKTELERTLSDNQHQIDDLVPAVAVSTGIIGLLRSDRSDDTDTLQFEIVRGSQVVPADVTTPLEPGDLLRVRRSPSKTLLSGASDARTNEGMQKFLRAEQ